MATNNTSNFSSINQLEETLETYLVDKAPFQIPQGGKDFIVMVAPWLIIITALMALPAIMALIGLGGMMGPWTMNYRFGFGSGWWISTVILAISVVFELVALPGLFARTMQGWRYVFYAQLVSIVSSLVVWNIGGAIIGGIIGLYILFQVKEMYK